MGHLLLLIPILFVGYITIRDDLREGKIFNKRIIQGLVAGIVAYLLIGSMELVGAPEFLCSGPLPEDAWHWSVVALTDLGLGLAVGILLWLLGIWAAGDAKLFALYAFLVPPACYTHSFLPAFPSLPVLVNVFAFVFLYLLVDLLRTSIPTVVEVMSDPDRRRETARAAPMAILKFMPLLLVFVAMFAGIRSLREVSREGLEPFLEVSDFTMFMILFLVFRPLMKLVTNKYGAIVFSALSAAAIGYLIWRHGWQQIPELIQPSIFAVVLLVFARAYPTLGHTTRKVMVSDLKPGMMIARESLMALDMREKREEKEALAKGEELPQAQDEEPGSTPRPSRFGDMTVEGLTDEQIRYVTTRWDDDEPIGVSRTIPFSPFLAAGALITVVIGGPITMFIEIS